MYSEKGSQHLTSMIGIVGILIMFPLNICSHVVSLVCHDQLVLEKPKEKPIVAGPKPQ